MDKTVHVQAVEAAIPSKGTCDKETLHALSQAPLRGVVVSCYALIGFCRSNSLSDCARDKVLSGTSAAIVFAHPLLFFVALTGAAQVLTAATAALRPVRPWRPF